MSLALASLILAQAVAAAPSADPKSDPVVCRAGESEVGTHMRPKPVCMKKSEWAELQRATDTEVNRIKDRGAFNPGMADGHGPH